MAGAGEQGSFDREEEFVLQEIAYSKVKRPETPREAVALWAGTSQA
jgi:hypothetical protein